MNRQLKPVLQLLFNEIYGTGIYPAQWSSGIIVPTYMKGNRENPSNYRGFTLTSVMSKLFTHMLNQIINVWSEESGILSLAQFAHKKATTPQKLPLSLTLHCHFILKLLGTHVVGSLISQRSLMN